ncbi:MAG: DegT/DnrJ/EryC1/StrS family aminotransferase [Oscillospiraceae bacterium]
MKLLELKGIKEQYKNIKNEINASVLNVLNSGEFIDGEIVEKFENELAEYVGVKHCITCSNGTTALYMILKYLEIGQGDAVIVPDYTFFASAEVISLVGAIPIFADVSEKSYNIDENKIEDLIVNVKTNSNLKLKAIIAVDLFGQSAEYEKIQQISDKYNLFLIEDAAQSIGGKFKNKKCGSFGVAAGTSFFPSKPLGCYGDGGAILTDDDCIEKYIRSYKCHGKGKNKYDNEIIGVNSRLDTIQAAILSVKLKSFTEYEMAKIQEISSIYNDNLKNYVSVAEIQQNTISSYAQYIIKCKSLAERTKIIKNLEKNNIPSAIYYPKPLHKLKAFECIDLYADLSISTKLSEILLAIPFHPYLKIQDIMSVSQVIKNSI